MDENSLVFDRKKHLLYSNDARKLIRSRLHDHYPDQMAESVWEEFQRIYVSFLDDLPFLGGRKNYQARGVYDSIALLAYYEAVPDKPTLDELDQMNRDLFVPVYKSNRFLDLNRGWMMKLAHAVFRRIEHGVHAHQEDWPGNYHMEVEPFNPKQGIHYRFHSCPIADFARAHGYTDLMPALCNADYPMLAAMHATLIRTSTCSCGNYCDYWIVGDKSPLAAAHPLKKNKDGYLCND